LFVGYLGMSCLELNFPYYESNELTIRVFTFILGVTRTKIIEECRLLGCGAVDLV
jgi:hypothetical protein